MNQTHILIEYSNARPLARERKRFSFFLTTRTFLKQTDGANEKMRQAHADKAQPVRTRRRRSSRASLFEVQVHADPMEAREEEQRGEEEEEEKNQQRVAQKYDDADDEKTKRTPPPGRRRRRRRTKQRERRREETGEKTGVKTPRETTTIC
jgi:hypothetical protein